MRRDQRVLLPALALIGVVIVLVVLLSKSNGNDEGGEVEPAVDVTPTRIALLPTADPPPAAMPLPPGDYGYPFRGDTSSQDQLHSKAVRCDAENLLVIETEKASYYVTLAPELNIFCSVALPDILQKVGTDQDGKLIGLDKKRFGIRLFEEPTVENQLQRFGINLIWEPAPLVFYRTPSVMVVTK